MIKEGIGKKALEVSAGQNREIKKKCYIILKREKKRKHKAGHSKK